MKHLIILSAIALAGCGGGGSSPQPFFQQPSRIDSTIETPISTPAVSTPPIPISGSGPAGIPQQAPEPVAPEPESTPEPSCPSTPEEALAAATRDSLGRIIAIPSCMTRPDPLTATAVEIDTWNAICQTARCMVTFGVLP